MSVPASEAAKLTEDGEARTRDAELTPERRIAELEQRVLLLEAELRQAEATRDAAEVNVRAGEDILAAVTHDLRNPLGTIVMGATALMQTDPGGDPKLMRVRNVAERMQRQAERMTHQIANLGDFAAIQSGRLALRRATHLPAAILAAVADLSGPIARERGVNFESHSAAELPALDCDGDRVVQVLTNLVGNAVKVTPRGGTIEAGARREDVHGAADHGVVFFVRDTGPGIPRDELASLFSPPWRTTQPSYKGAGLGFAIARGIVEAHGGQIWADSELGGGTTVFFVLGAAPGA
ncbi:MAG TPA: HAMP domain-containing sensor histidine kinase [Kofleriaceae bacterium]|nr:HAMP domain-containing sensor histidine kinase [Kofleriaceae bacterium]